MSSWRALAVAEEDDVPGYSRTEFPHWITLYSTCDARAVSGPGNRKPSLQSYWCTCSRAWIRVKANYHLTANPAEAEALSRMLDTCDA